MGSERDAQARPQAGVRGLHLRVEGEIGVCSVWGKLSGMRLGYTRVEMSSGWGEQGSGV